MLHEISLKYGLNPDQKPSCLSIEGKDMPLKVIQGNPGYINILDALNGWQLVRDLRKTCKLPAATSFKHVSPAGAAIGQDLATAYTKARACDRMSSFGDFIALSDVCDEATAKVIEKEVSDGVIAPGYEKEALEIFARKRKGSYLVLEIDPSYEPETKETKEVFGLTLEQPRSLISVDESLLENIVTDNKDIPKDAKLDLLLALITAKYTQSNSVCYAYQGQTIGVGAGQQSRIHCTRLAGDKANIWHLRQHPKTLKLAFREDIKMADKDNVIDLYISDNYQELIVSNYWEDFLKDKPEPLTTDEKQEWIKGLTGVSLGSDAFFPFDDNIKRAKKSGVSYIAQAGGSIRDQEIIDTCNALNIAMVFTGLRLFHH